MRFRRCGSRQACSDWLYACVRAYALRFSPSGSKDTVQNKTETEKKLGRILSNENWGASSTAMNEIAALTRD